MALCKSTHGSNCNGKLASINLRGNERNSPRPHLSTRDIHSLLAKSWRIGGLDLWWICFGASARNQIAAGVRAEAVHPGVIHTGLAPSVRANIVQRDAGDKGHDLIASVPFRAVEPFAKP